MLEYYEKIADRRLLSALMLLYSRSPNQYFVWKMENPLIASKRGVEHYKKFDKFYNWTMTNTITSDIYNPMDTAKLSFLGTIPSNVGVPEISKNKTKYGVRIMKYHIQASSKKCPI